jgi:hypothetical protein
MGVDAVGNGLTIASAGNGTILVSLVSPVTCSAGTLVGGASSTCTVTLTQLAPTGGAGVALSSNNTSLTVPASVNVVAGTTTATFIATAGASIASNQTATVTATLGSSTQTVNVSLVASGGSTSGTAAFVTTDTTTQGSWKGIYGAEGEAINGDSANYPSYAQVTFTGADPFVWASSTTDARALQKAAAPDRIAPCWFNSSIMSIDVNLTDAKIHQMSLYFLDWDGAGRVQRVDVLDAASQAVLDTQTVSGFQNGKYLIWNLSGHVTLKITLLGGLNDVVSGLFFGPPPFVRNDAITQGNWKTVYGADGEVINGDSASYPSYAQVTFTGATPFVWTSSTTDGRASQNAAASGRIASGWYTNSNMSIDVNLTDGKLHQVALYFLDWDGLGSRAETVEVVDAASQAVLDTRTVSSFQNGQYLVWNLSGHVTLQIALTGGADAVVNGLFCGGFFCYDRRDNPGHVAGPVRCRRRSDQRRFDQLSRLYASGFQWGEPIYLGSLSQRCPGPPDDFGSESDRVGMVRQLKPKHRYEFDGRQPSSGGGLFS